MVKVGDPWITVKTDKFPDVMALLRDDERFKFDSLHNLSGLDQKDKVEIVYHLYSLPRKHWCVIKAEAPRANGTVPTVAHLWKTAIWHEREAFDMFGVKFAGNPDLRRILCPDDWEGHPLLKDYKVQEFYRGMPVPYHEEHWTGNGTPVSSIADISVETVEQWFQKGLPTPAAATTAAGPASVASAVATAPKPAAAPGTAVAPAAPAAAASAAGPTATPNNPQATAPAKPAGAASPAPASPEAAKPPGSPTPEKPKEGA